MAMANIDTLPEAWLAQFDGERLDEKVAVSALLSTVSDDGWPHASFLGAGEVLVRDERRIALLLWQSSTTAGNIARTGRATLFAAADGNVWEVRLEAGPGEDDGATGPLRFETRVLAVRSHAAPYAEVTGMIGFRLLEPAPTIARWRAQIVRLREFC
jgi:hypothetical protein